MHGAGAMPHAWAHRYAIAKRLRHILPSQAGPTHGHSSHPRNREAALRIRRAGQPRARRAAPSTSGEHGISESAVSHQSAELRHQPSSEDL